MRIYRLVRLISLLPFLSNLWSMIRGWTKYEKIIMMTILFAVKLFFFSSFLYKYRLIFTSEFVSLYVSFFEILSNKKSKFSLDYIWMLSSHWISFQDFFKIDVLFLMHSMYFLSLSEWGWKTSIINVSSNFGIRFLFDLGLK